MVPDRSVERTSPSDPQDRIPDSEIRGRLVARDGTPIVGARVLAVASFVAAKFPAAVNAPENFAVPEHDGAVAITREGGRFGLFGLVANAEYEIFADVRREEPCVRFVGPARIGAAVAPTSDLDLVDSSRWLGLAFELDSELTALADRDANARVAVQISFEKPTRSRIGTSFPLRSRPTLRVAAESPLDFSFQGEGIAPLDLFDVTLDAAEFERTEIVRLRGWGEGNRVRVFVEDETGARLDRAAVSVLPGGDIEPPPWASAPAATETRLTPLESGEFVAENVGPGPVTIVVAAPLSRALALSTATIDVPERGEVTHVARMVRGGSVIVRVTEFALPMRAIEIVRDLPGDPSSGVRFADPSGNVSTGVMIPTKPQDLRNGHVLAPGDYALKWLQSPARVHRKAFRIVAGETTSVTIP